MKGRTEIGLAATVIVLIGAVLGLTGTLNGTHHATVSRCIPKEGAGVLGVCVPKYATSGPRLSVHGPFVPDVSYFQGAPNWSQAKPHIPGAIVRVADGSFSDPAFARNWSELRRLHVWHAAYFFLRPGNCQGEADRMVKLVGEQGGFDSGPPIADAEVPLNNGCQQSFINRVERDLHWSTSVIYTAPGTWPGGSHGNALLWVASYGPTPGCVWTCAHVAWQYTDGQIGPYPHCITGIGCGDISTDNGITAILRHPKPRPHPCHRVCRGKRLHALYGRRRALRRDLHRYGCWRRIHAHQHLGPKCVRWTSEDYAINVKIRSLGGK